VIEFYVDDAEEHRWRIVDEEDGAIIHACHEGFTAKTGALNNLLINSSMLNVFVARLARGDDNGASNSSVAFNQDNDDKIRWRATANNGEIVGASHKGFGSMMGAVNNLMITHTMLTVFIAELAMARTAHLHGDGDGGE
jgi:uncharacterized protein YegP (UPF0339 family)